MPLETRLTEMLGIEHPLVMGGLTGVGTVELAAAVSNAGGLGMFTAHNAGSEFILENPSDYSDRSLPHFVDDRHAPL